jgi:hypothetical protein
MQLKKTGAQEYPQQKEKKGKFSVEVSPGLIIKPILATLLMIQSTSGDKVGRLCFFLKLLETEKLAVP